LEQLGLAILESNDNFEPILLQGLGVL